MPQHTPQSPLCYTPGTVALLLAVARRLQPLLWLLRLVDSALADALTTALDRAEKDEEDARRWAASIRHADGVYEGVAQVPYRAAYQYRPGSQGKRDPFGQRLEPDTRAHVELLSVLIPDDKGNLTIEAHRTFGEDVLGEIESECLVSHEDYLDALDDFRGDELRDRRSEVA